MLLEAVVDVFATKAMLELGVSSMTDNPVDVSKSQLDAFIRDLLNKNINADEAMGVIQKMFYFFQ
jgi:hypothetical protein